MSYLEQSPDPLLRRVVACYWSSTGSSNRQAYRVLPDGCTDIIFNLGSATSTLFSRQIMVSGMMTTFRDVQDSKAPNLVGIRLHPGQLSLFSKVPIHHLKNEVAISSDVTSHFEQSILEKLAEYQDLESQSKYLDKMLLHLLLRQQPHQDVISSIALNKLINQPNTRIRELANELSLSNRQLERKFKSTVGVTMKEFQSIHRFIRSVESISSSNTKSLLHIAFENGYYDHAHLTNDIKRFSGRAPEYFR